MAPTAVSFINMKGGVGKTTLAFNIAHYAAQISDPPLKVLAVDLDPQANLSQCLLGAADYLEYIQENNPTTAEMFAQAMPPGKTASARAVPDPELIVNIRPRLSRTLDLVPSRLKLARTLRDPLGKEEILARFLALMRRTTISSSSTALPPSPCSRWQPTGHHAISSFRYAPNSSRRSGSRCSRVVWKNSAPDIRIRKSILRESSSMAAREAIRRGKNLWPSATCAVLPMRMVGRYSTIRFSIRDRIPTDRGKGNPYSARVIAEISLPRNSMMWQRSSWFRWVSSEQPRALGRTENRHLP